MVFINSKKFACESCIKGHRSSSCHHNDRPLFEIKKKGRPVSQCEKCREARHARRIHAKCTCDGDKGVGSSAGAGPSAAKKGKRFIPTIPSLPNGLKDAMKALDSSSSAPIVPRAKVAALLNPRGCTDTSNCGCLPQSTPGSSSSVSPSTSDSSHTPNFSGLSALAQAASCCSPASAVKEGTNPFEIPPLVRPIPNLRILPGLSSLDPKLNKHGHLTPSAITTSSFALTTPATFVSAHTHYHPPTFSQASSSTFPSVTHADDGCCCGHRCECPECTVHNSSQSSSSKQTSSRGHNHSPQTHSKAECGHDCLTCVDHEGGIELPSASSGGKKRTSSYLDDFFARAAALPMPPKQATRTTSLDPTNVIVYPPSLFSSRSNANEQRELAFGLVKVPKLECCNGKCSCPEDKCSCGTECGGCCD